MSRSVEGQTLWVFLVWAASLLHVAQHGGAYFVGICRMDGLSVEKHAFRDLRYGRPLCLMSRCVVKQMF
jgi:hypothetical protein